MREWMVEMMISRPGGRGSGSWLLMMMTFITQGGEGQGNTKKERKATKSRGRGLEEGARRALMRQDGEEGCGERG